MEAQFINQLLLKGETFAAWAMPGGGVQFMLAEADEVSFIKEESELEQAQGFVFAPFQSDENCPLILLSGTHLKTTEDVERYLASDQKVSATGQSIRHRPFVIPRSQYLDDISQTVEELRQSKFSKVVISRLVEAKLGGKTVGKLFADLREQNPRALVYVANIPKAGLWVGATPESLLQQRGSQFETMSLAGTQPKSEDADYRWRTKEIEEQAFVSRYILEAFHDLGIHPYDTTGPTTLESGGLAHLQTSFRFERSLLQGKLSAFVQRLHPTPAVCGLPKAESMAFIAKMEKHQRRYYAGYLGPWQLAGETQLFVNLRCMELRGEQGLLYVGGGITSRSKSEEEWEETEKKAEVLLHAISKGKQEN